MALGREQLIKDLHTAQEQWFKNAQTCAVKPPFPTPEPNLSLNDGSDLESATGAMSYINIASIIGSMIVKSELMLYTFQ